VVSQPGAGALAAWIMGGAVEEAAGDVGQGRDGGVGAAVVVVRPATVWELGGGKSVQQARDPFGGQRLLGEVGHHDVVGREQGRARGVGGDAAAWVLQDGQALDGTVDGLVGFLVSQLGGHVQPGAVRWAKGRQGVAS